MDNRTAKAEAIPWREECPNNRLQATPRPFELTGEEKTFAHPITGEPVTVYRIRATVDYPEHTYQEVSAGDVGGWVQSLDQLSDDSWVESEAMLFDNATLEHASRLDDYALAFGNAQVDWSMSIWGEGWIYGDACVAGHGNIGEYARIYGNVALSYMHTQIAGKTVICGEAFPDDYYMDHELELNDNKVHTNLPAEDTLEMDYWLWRVEQLCVIREHFIVGTATDEAKYATLQHLAHAVYGDTPVAVEMLREATCTSLHRQWKLTDKDADTLLNAYLSKHESTRPRPDTSILDNMANAPEPAPYPVTLSTSSAPSPSAIPEI